MLRSCSRCLIVTLFSEQYDSIDLISSKVIISVFIAKVAGQRTCHNMHFFGCLHCGLKLLKTKQNSGFSSSPKVPYKRKKHSRKFRKCLIFK